VQPRSYIPLLPDELLRHFQLVADALETPIGIYNNPEATGVEITPSAYCSIIDSTGAVVTKDAGDDLFTLPEVRNSCDDRFHYLWGNITLLPAALALGADGCCVALASVLPREVVDLYDASREHKLESDPSTYDRLLPLFRALDVIGTNPRSIKALANMLGLPLGGHRDPVTVLPEPQQQLLRDALAELDTV
jgi:4-hydroxy-tetrahydrodipicolinate synthase